METLFFAALFFLCSSDLFFAVRIHDLNLRYGQILILLGVIVIVARLSLASLRDWSPIEPPFKILKFWIPFWLAYALAVALSQDYIHGFLKLGWAVFNIGGAALIALQGRLWNPLKTGFSIGIAAIALTIWVQFVAIYLFGDITSASQSPAGWSFIRLDGIFAGYVQNSGQFGSVNILRPHAFFYEPSYAGCALTFAFPLSIAVGLRENSSFWRSTLFPALVFGAAAMTSSRSSILGLLISLLIVAILGLVKRKFHLLKTVSKVFFTSILLLGLLALAPGPRAYLGFFLGPLGPKSAMVRVTDPNSSEGWRLANVKNSLRVWKSHPLFGMGVPPLPADKTVHGLGQTSESMWLEVGVESGLLGFLAFGFAIFKSISDSMKKTQDIGLVILVVAALAAHLIVSMNFTSTFPRLDYWLLFFFALGLCLEKPLEKL
jgi:O-antigen ligase